MERNIFERASQLDDAIAKKENELIKLQKAKRFLDSLGNIVTKGEINLNVEVQDFKRLNLVVSDDEIKIIVDILFKNRAAELRTLKEEFAQL
jgi:hypothetical protein